MFIYIFNYNTPKQNPMETCFWTLFFPLCIQTYREQKKKNGMRALQKRHPTNILQQKTEPNQKDEMGQFDEKDDEDFSIQIGRSHELIRRKQI